MGFTMHIRVQVDFWHQPPCIDYSLERCKSHTQWVLKHLGECRRYLTVNQASLRRFLCCREGKTDGMDGQTKLVRLNDNAHNVYYVK